MSRTLPPRPRTEDLEHLLRTRQPVLRFVTDPLPRPDVLRVCQAGADAGLPVTPDDVHTARWLVFARAVGDTAPGVHEYRDGELVPLAGLPAAEAMAALASSASATAPCVVAPVWIRGAARTGPDIDDHLDLLLRTGASLHAAYLLAMRSGLGGHLFRNPHAATSSGGWDGLAARPFLALAFGHPVPRGNGR
ncbi:hypothetical protein [Micromonospora sp. NPDC003241]